MTRVRTTLESEKVGDEPLVDNGDWKARVFVDKFMHSDQITERLEFIKYYATRGKKVRLTADYLDTLWDELVTKTYVENDSKLMYTWLREICDQCSQVYKHG